MLNKKVAFVLLFSCISVQGAAPAEPLIHYTLRNESGFPVRVRIFERHSVPSEQFMSPITTINPLETAVFDVPPRRSERGIGGGAYRVVVMHPTQPEGDAITATDILLHNAINNFARIGTNFIPSETMVETMNIIEGAAQNRAHMEQVARDVLDREAEEAEARKTRKERIAERREAAEERRAEAATAREERKVEAERKEEATEERITQARERRAKRLKEKREAAADRRARSK